MTDNTGGDGKALDQVSANRTRVIVVDDHSRFRELLISALDGQADMVSIGCARSAEEGVSLCLSLRPDVVVMDYHLGDGDGLSAAGRILAQAPATGIVILTGDPSTQIRDDAALLGTCFVLPKGGSLATLLEALRKARPAA
jgi:DNA-binding NarL/FixJ family response regulator